MKKRLVISLVLILLVVLPVFALGGKEDSKKVVEPVSTASSTDKNGEIVPIVEEKNETVDTAVSTEQTAISTPLYKVELTEATYITQEDVDAAVEYMSGYYQTTVSQNDAVEYLINQILVNQALVRALSNNEIPLYDGTFNEYVSYQLSVYASYYGITLTTVEEANAFLEQLGITYEDFANQVLQDYAREYYVKAHSNGKLDNISQPTDEEVKTFYNENLDLFLSDEAVQLAHIYFGFNDDKEAAKVKADTTAKNLSQGLSFEDAVSIYSEDEPTKGNKGEFGVWIGKNDAGAISSFGQNAMDEIFKLKVGEVSNVIESAQGYHIFKLIDHKNSVLLGLDDPYSLNYEYTVAEVIAQQLYSTKQTLAYSEVYEEIINSLREEATIKSLK